MRRNSFPTTIELDKPKERIWPTGTRRPEFCCRTCNRSATGAPQEDRRRNCRWRIRQNAQGGTIEAGGAAGRVAGAAGEAGTRAGPKMVAGARNHREFPICVALKSKPEAAATLNRRSLAALAQNR